MGWRGGWLRFIIENRRSKIHHTIQEIKDSLYRTGDKLSQEDDLGLISAAQAVGSANPSSLHELLLCTTTADANLMASPIQCCRPDFLHLYLKFRWKKTILFQHLEISLLSDHTALTASSDAQISWVVEEPQMSGYNVHRPVEGCLPFFFFCHLLVLLLNILNTFKTKLRT